MKILGIESSCDETAAAVVTVDREILSHSLRSQITEHKVFGGVVPEIAARSHLELIDPIIEKAMSDAGIKYEELDAVAAGCGPGLIGGVMVGMMAAKAIALAANIPFVAVNHLEGHALTARFSEDEPLEFPYFCLLVSGGHTQILVVNGVGDYQLLGTTLDDAVGECFDKSAKMMGLGSPGGPQIEQMASEHDSRLTMFDEFLLPIPMQGKPGCDFSFSGLKTSVRQHIANITDNFQRPLTKEDCRKLSHNLQLAICKSLELKLSQAMDSRPDIKSLVVCGGVSANVRIRTALKDLTMSRGMRFCAPPLSLCGDNGVMIAWAGLEKFMLGERDSLSFPARPRWPLTDLSARNITDADKQDIL